MAQVAVAFDIAGGVAGAGVTDRVLAPTTICAHAGVEAHAGPLVDGIYPSTTFVRDADYALPADGMYLRDDQKNARALTPAVLGRGFAQMVCWRR